MHRNQGYHNYIINQADGADLIFNNRPALVPEIGSNHQASCLDYAGCVTETLISDWGKKANEKKRGKRD